MRMWITIAMLLGTATASADKPKTNVEASEDHRAVHPHLKSFTMNVVEDGKDGGKEVVTMTAGGHIAKREISRDGKVSDTTEYTWDAAGHLIKHVAKSDTVSTVEWKYTLDKQGRIATAVQSGAYGNQTTTYAWDAKGAHEETTMGTGKGGKPVFMNRTTFDAAGRKLKICVSTAMVSQETKAETVCKTTEYDKQGSVKRLVDESKKTTYTNTYDKAGRLIKAVSSKKDDPVVTQTWNDNGDIATYSSASPNLKLAVTFSYQPK